MEFIKDKYFFWGILAGLLWTSFGVLVLLFVLSDSSIEASFSSLYQQKKIGWFDFFRSLDQSSHFLYRAT